MLFSLSPILLLTIKKKKTVTEEHGSHHLNKGIKASITATACVVVLWPELGKGTQYHFMIYVSQEPLFNLNTKGTQAKNEGDSTYVNDRYPLRVPRS